MWGTVSGDTSPVSQWALSKWSCRLERFIVFLRAFLSECSLWILSGQHFKNVSLMFLCVTEFSRALMNTCLADSQKLWKLHGGVGLEDLQRSLPTLSVLWFCEIESPKTAPSSKLSGLGVFWVWKAFCPVDLALLCRVLSRGTWNKALVSGHVRIHGFSLQGWLRGAVYHPHPLGTAASCHIHGQAAAVAREEVCVQHRGTQSPPALCFL